jgi:SagB-type dehydrogenase family enzyme
MKYVVLFLIVLAGPETIAFAEPQARSVNLRVIQLPEPELTGSMSIEESLAKRRSIRSFNGRKLDYTQIGQLAWAAQGITESKRGLRTAPSAGAIYPMQIYFVTAEALFVYRPAGHTLELLHTGDLRQEFAKAAFGQQYVAQAPCDIIIAGSVQKLAVRYGRKARTFALLEAGHIAQNIHLQAVSMGLGSVPIGAFDENAVKRLCGLGATEFEPFYIIPVGYPATAGNEAVREQEQTEVTKMQNSGAKKAVLIIASADFRDEELFETQDALKGAQVQTIIASTKTGPITGMLGGQAKAQILVSSIDVNDYDAVVFVGGRGATQYFDDATALDIARKAASKSKLLAAICIAPTTLANAGVLNGVKATCFSSERSKLEKAGAIYTGAPVEKDGLIITADGPRSAAKFGKTIADALAGK